MTLKPPIMTRKAQPLLGLETLDFNIGQTQWRATTRAKAHLLRRFNCV